MKLAQCSRLFSQIIRLSIPPFFLQVAERLGKPQLNTTAKLSQVFQASRNRQRIISGEPFEHRSGYQFLFVFGSSDR